LQCSNALVKFLRSREICKSVKSGEGSQAGARARTHTQNIHKHTHTKHTHTEHKYTKHTHKTQTHTQNTHAHTKHKLTHKTHTHTQNTHTARKKLGLVGSSHIGRYLRYKGDQKAIILPYDDTTLCFKWGLAH